MKPSWNDAPEWATVLLVNKSINNLYAFAEEYENNSKFQRNDDLPDTVNNYLLKAVWDIVEYRPEASCLPNTRNWKVGEHFTFGNDKRTITYLGKDRVCYLIPENDNQEVCVPKDTFMKEAKLYVEKSPLQTIFEDWLLEEHGLESEWNPDRNCYEHFAAHLAWKAFQKSFELYAF